MWVHHHELHSRGDEKLWWQIQKIDPLPAAEELWQATKFGKDVDQKS